MARGRAAGVAPRRGGRAGAYGAPGILARVIEIVVAIVAAILALGVLLVVLEANRGNGLVDAILGAARWLAGAFRDFFSLDDRKLEVAVNWGLALVVYVVVGRLIAGLLRRPRP